MADKRQIQGEGPTNPDELTLAQTTERVIWGLPGDEGAIGQHPGYVPAFTNDQYAEGILVGYDLEEDAQPIQVEQLIGARVDAPRQFDLPHEATHRRYEPPRVASVSQTAAGYSVVAKANPGLHYVKLLACALTLDAAGTIKFVTGDDAGVESADLTGTLNMGGAATAPLILPPAQLQNPWLWTPPAQSLGIFTATGKAQGWVMYVYSPYDQ